MNNELGLLNKNLTEAKMDLETARVAFNATNSDAAYDSVMACHKAIFKIQDEISSYLMNTR